MIKQESAYSTLEIQDFPKKCQNPGFLGCGRQENLFLLPVFDYIYIYTCFIYIYVYVYIYCIYIRIYVYLVTYANIYIYMQIHIYIYIYIYTYNRICIYLNIHLCIYIMQYRNHSGAVVILNGDITIYIHTFMSGYIHIYLSSPTIPIMVNVPWSNWWDRQISYVKGW